MGEIVRFCITKGNIDDRAPVVSLARLFEEGLKLITRIKRNMKNKLMTIKEKNENRNHQ